MLHFPQKNLPFHILTLLNSAKTHQGQGRNVAEQVNRLHAIYAYFYVIHAWIFRKVCQITGFRGCWLIPKLRGLWAITLQEHWGYTVVWEGESHNVVTAHDNTRSFCASREGPTQTQQTGRKYSMAHHWLISMIVILCIQAFSRSIVLYICISGTMNYAVIAQAREAHIQIYSACH